MNVAAGIPADPGRRLQIEAFDALIERRLSEAQAHSGYAAQRLLHQLADHGLATLTAIPATDKVRLLICGVPCRAESALSAYGLLRSWQAEARRKLAFGVTQ